MNQQSKPLLGGNMLSDHQTQCKHLQNNMNLGMTAPMLIWTTKTAPVSCLRPDPPALAPNGDWASAFGDGCMLGMKWDYQYWVQYTLSTNIGIAIGNHNFVNDTIHWVLNPACIEVFYIFFRLIMVGWRTHSRKLLSTWTLIPCLRLTTKSFLKPPTGMRISPC